MHHFLIPELPPFEAAKAISLSQAAPRLATRGKPVNRIVLWRWAKKGYRCRGWDAAPLLLPTVMIGGARFTMPSWVELFQAARIEMGRRVTEARTPRATRTIKQATVSHRRAVAQLQKAGFTVG